MSRERAERRHREVLRLYAEALASFGRRVPAVARNQWQAPTPCAGWSVRDLVNHVAAEQLWAPELLLGATPAEVGDRFEGDVLGADPAAGWARAAAGARAAFAVPDALALTVHLSYGDRSALDYCTQLTIDLVVHTWDLARATGQDSHLAPELVEFGLHEVAPYADRLAATERFAAPVPTAPNADPQTRLLGLVGRHSAPHPPVDPELAD
ncbi:TIGR03086 family metal-binding protein [Kitasatospora sp. NBC_01287]|uniref:TIGR03086 family metal-binding protein n=1 Tax=Kitasatospora sp. NBC_01287 TaxID=2903573 RepID=UPI002254835A|nr:TIGR03086 family metal-binding protein [Kitasatospora sp. NBC_01287]MCX4750827.1 TIGR03086 family metal-binding protein [Kitasatospora sp. NBC_01287]